METSKFNRPPHHLYTHKTAQITKDITLTTVTTLPAVTSVSTVTNITDYDAGASWQRMCMPDPAGGSQLCECTYSAVTGHIADENTSGWKYVGDATVAGEPCTEWSTSSPGVSPTYPEDTVAYFVTKAHPTVLRKSIINGTGITIGETMSGYDLGPPPPSAWTPPPEWKCPPATVPAAVGQSPPRSPAATMQEHAIQLAQLAAIAHQNLIASPK